MEKRMLNLEELAEYINQSPQTIRNMRSAGTFPIPPKQITRKLLWDKKTVDAFLDKLPERD